MSLIATAVDRGWHVRVGLEDAPWGSTRSNAAWVADAVAQVVASGAQLADVRSIRRALGQAGSD